MITGRIIGTGSSLPDRILTNRELETMVDTSDEWISTRTGIKQRHIASESESTADLAVRAAQKALEASGISPDQLDLVIVSTSTPDYQNFPSTACLVQGRIGANNAAAFDLSAACSGFVYGLTVANQFIASGLYKTILIIGADTLSKFVNWEDRNTCVLFGDGAGAAILQTSPEASLGLLSSYLAADGSGAGFLINPTGGSRKPITAQSFVDKDHFITMDGRAVFKFSTRVIVEGVEKSLSKAGLSVSDIDLLIPHQANTRIIDHAVEKLGLSPQKVCVNIHQYGNTSAATIPIALDEAVTSRRVQPGQVIVTIGFGAGLTWGSNVIRWG